jgi:RNA polymerase sigma-70 factor (ECF subfamily)
MDGVDSLIEGLSDQTAGLWDDDDALRSLMDDLLRYFLRRLPTREVSADCVSDTMLVLWQKKASLPQEHGDLRAFAFGVARNVLLKTQRDLVASKRRAAPDTETPLPSHADGADLRMDVERMLAPLKAADRDLLLLTIWEQFTLADAARIMGISPATARKRHSRILQRLSTRMP